MLAFSIFFLATYPTPSTAIFLEYSLIFIVRVGFGVLLRRGRLLFIGWIILGGHPYTGNSSLGCCRGYRSPILGGNIAQCLQWMLPARWISCCGHTAVLLTLCEYWWWGYSIKVFPFPEKCNCVFIHQIGGFQWKVPVHTRSDIFQIRSAHCLVVWTWPDIFQSYFLEQSLTRRTWDTHGNKNSKYHWYFGFILLWTVCYCWLWYWTAHTMKLKSWQPAWIAAN